ncbi:YbfB/YjiJ family MFS transporter [Cupriavidus sp. CV2]|uniref:YbfB/YjiJ family MFS transporter n=1 Tax=Cupriavidus ulmosensis TaxID=3065913 RepID=UPI00296ADCB5|nr:YbfB/YjiJ family MFS transporter [Cupriavidus sp. CV2]MDW3685969.1 YbfB/YjiJ family MFS transporter [Cupriavidus sp. CV2]
MSSNPVLHTPLAASRSQMWRHIFAGLCASLVSIGLARFAYTPLLPSLIQAHWFAASDVVYLGAANLAGYLVGALLGRPIASRISNTHTLRLMMVLVTLAFFACAFPVSVAWFFAWRLVSGVAGGAIMVLVAATVLPHVPANSKGIASGAVFLGLGLGIAGSGTIVPLLLELGLRDTWIGLAVLSAVLTAASWFGWPASGRAGHKATEHKTAVEMDRGASAIVKILYAEYALMAIGLVPSMVFLVDFIARGLGAGAHLGSLFWILYGLGAIFGPPVYGFFADRLGSRTALRALLLVQAIAVAILAASSNHLLIGLVTIVIGTFPPGIVPVVLARVHETIPGNATQQNVVWSRATTVFAAFQALAGYAYSAIFNSSGGNHRVLFVIGAVAIVVGLVVDVVASSSSRASSQEGGVAR